MPPRTPWRDDRGQASVLLALILLGVLLFAIALAVSGRAAIDRQRARTAADAVALAAAENPSHASALAGSWQDHIESVRVGIESAHAMHGVSQARAWADVVEEPPDAAPALVAIIARISQLSGTPLTPLVLQDRLALFSPDDGRIVARFAADLGLCEAGRTIGRRSFRLC